MFGCKRTKILLIGNNFKHFEKIADLIRNSIKHCEIIFISNDNNSDSFSDICESNADAIFYFMSGKEYEDLTTINILKKVANNLPVILVSEKLLRHNAMKEVFNGVENYLTLEDLTPTKFKKIFHSAINYYSIADYARHYIY
ncbi:MAG: hypothetical protein SFT90_07085 [Rickettsiales bacterium]|nr:hypothetical protein [Rickettsiales bacterium]